MSENLFYRLGRGSLQEAKSTLEKLLPGIGEVAVYLDGDGGLEAAYRELLVVENVKYIEGGEGLPGSVRLDLWRAYLRSRNKLLVSDRDVSEYREELL